MIFTEIVNGQVKETQFASGYTNRSPIPIERCYLCKFFLSQGTESGNECAKVAGKVKRQGVCAYFERRATATVSSDTTSGIH